MGEKEKKPILLWIFVLLLCCAFGIGGWYMGTKYADKETKQENKEEKKEEPKTPEEDDDVEDKRTAEEIIEPFLNVINYCSADDTFYYDKVTKYEDFPASAAIEIALDNFSKEELEKIKKEAAEKPDDYDWELEEGFPDIETSHVKEKIAYTFGKDKTVKLPKKLNLDGEFTSYDLKGDKYVLAGQGGGCTGFNDYITTKYVDSKKENGKLIIQVNFIYVTYDEDNIQAAEDPIIPVIFYNGLKKDRVISKLDSNGKEQEEAEKLLKGDKTDYLLFTFGVEDGHYIFEKVEMVKR